MLVLGEVLTSLLPTSAALPADAAERLLTLTTGAAASRSDRPISFVVSPERLVGVDCQVPAGRHGGVRGIGTVATRALLTGGHVLQSSARTVAVSSRHTRRLPWSYYLARPGTLQIVGRYREDDLAEAVLERHPKPPLLNLASIAEHTTRRVLADVRVAAKVPLASHRTTLRWAAFLDAGDEMLGFSVESGHHRAIRLSTRDTDPGDVAALCQDLALHDWLLTTLTGILDRAPLAWPKESAAVDRIQPAVDHLLHLWMPGARLGERARLHWERIERLAGFERQWRASVQRIRDHLALSTLRELSRLGASR
ncbi:SCO2521 family protein [Actinoplanes philippinensis]|uniref:SCO2521 family protein n=1 Tax=Actinoplanes philippinensis TaxID=35752 RepID=UPI0033DE52C5